METNVFYNRYCGSATFGCDRLAKNGDSWGISGNEAEQGGGIQGLKGECVGGISSVSSRRLPRARRCDLRYQKATSLRQQSGRLVL